MFEKQIETDIESIETMILGDLDSEGEFNSLQYSRERNLDHNQVVGEIKSLDSHEMVKAIPLSKKILQLTPDGQAYLKEKTPEDRAFMKLSSLGKMTIEDVKKEFGEFALTYGFQRKLFNLVKTKTDSGEINSLVLSPNAAVDQNFYDCLEKINAGEIVLDKMVEYLKQRKCIMEVTVTSFQVSKGLKFSLKKTKFATDLTMDLITTNKWKELSFKEYNLKAFGKEVKSGSLHPLCKARAQYKEILLEMGFEEMPTNQYVESSFWNFDTLFQPQSHPARDAHDTFFIEDPKLARIPDSEYWDRVKQVHEKGGYGSIGWRYPWSENEAKKNVLRTHTTGISSKMLFKLANQKEFKPAKYFSIDRVFRNESLDSTHLAEFHQFEGVIADKDIGLPELMAVIKEFFNKIGISSIKFKPTYNPYTEPSMEIHGYHPGLKKWIEVGNSGVFRPEMLKPMGLPDDVGVLGWGLSLERPTMIKFGIQNIRDLLGYKVSVKYIKDCPICCLTESKEKK